MTTNRSADSCVQLSVNCGISIIGEASDGPEAIRKAEELKPDLIVLDIGLPTVSGIEVARESVSSALTAKYCS